MFFSRRRFRATFDALKWIVDTVDNRPDRRAVVFTERLAEILVETAHYVGPVILKKHEHHKLCEVNRAYADYRKTT